LNGIAKVHRSYYFIKQNVSANVLVGSIYSSDQYYICTWP